MADTVEWVRRARKEGCGGSLRSIEKGKLIVIVIMCLFCTTYDNVDATATFKLAGRTICSILLRNDQTTLILYCSLKEHIELHRVHLTSDIL